MTTRHPLVERYLSQLTASLGQMTPADQEEVVQEIRTHVADAMAAGKPLDAVLESLGPADALARAYNVELLLHPRTGRRTPARVERYFALAGLIAVGSIPTIVITSVLGAIGVSFVAAGGAIFAAGVMGMAGTLPDWVQMDVPPIVAAAGGPVMAVIGVAALFGLVAYVRLAARTIRKVLPARA